MRAWSPRETRGAYFVSLLINIRLLGVIGDYAALSLNGSGAKLGPAYITANGEGRE